MPRAGATVSSLTVDVDRTERDFLDHMKAATGLVSDQNLLRVALFRLAQHLDVPVSVGTFRVRSAGGLKGLVFVPEVCATCGHHRRTRPRGET